MTNEAIDPRALALRVADWLTTNCDAFDAIPGQRVLAAFDQAEARAIAAFLREAVKETKRDDFIWRAAKFFDEDLTAGSFLREDGEGGFVGAIDRMAREIDRLREAVSPWVKITSAEDLPKKPGLKSYEYVDCLIFHKGEIKKRPWNCEHLCWDDEEYDDFYCDPMEPSHYMPLPTPPAAGGGE